MNKIGRIPLFLILSFIILDGSAFPDTVKPGDRIKIIKDNNSVIRGRLLGYNPRSIGIESTDSGIAYLNKSEILEFYVCKRGSKPAIRNGIAVGSWLGAVIGIAIEWPRAEGAQISLGGRPAKSYHVPDHWVILACVAGGGIIGALCGALYVSEVAVDKTEFFNAIVKDSIHQENSLQLRVNIKIDF